MTYQTRIPPLLSPYICVPPKDSLILCTNVLGASNNWLLIRYLHACLGDQHRQRGREEDAYEEKGAGDNVAVVFVSWMREFDFWRIESRRAVGLDLARLQQQGRFVFVDGLTDLCLPPAQDTPPARTPRRTSTPPPPAQARATIPHSTAPLPSNTQQQPETTNVNKPGQYALSDPSFATLSNTLNKALAKLTTHNPPITRAILILDTPTLPLSLCPTTTSAQSLTSTLLTLRSHPLIHSTIISLPVDDPFVDASRASEAEASPVGGSHARGVARTVHPPPETETAAFVAQCVGLARVVVGCRALGTGWAADVSGIVRCVRGGDAGGDAGDGGVEVGEGEWLYHVAGDGGVKVWGRGSGDGG